MLFALHYLLQMIFGFRAQGDDVGALINIMFYMPAAFLIEHPHRGGQAPAARRSCLQRGGGCRGLRLHVAHVDAGEVQGFDRYDAAGMESGEKIDL